MDWIREYCKVTTLAFARHLLFFQSFGVIMKGWKKLVLFMHEKYEDVLKNLVNQLFRYCTGGKFKFIFKSITKPGQLIIFLKDISFLNRYHVLPEAFIFAPEEMSGFPLCSNLKQRRSRKFKTYFHLQPPFS